MKDLKNKNNNDFNIDKVLKKSKKPRRIDWAKFFIILIITISVFVTGIFLGNTITEFKFNKITNAEQDLRLELLGLDLQYSLIEQDPCKVFNDTYLAETLDEFGNKVSYLENIHGVNNEVVKNTKKHYALLQIRHYLLKKKAVQQCNITHDFILFFYSNEKYCEKDCKEQGFVITSIREHRNSSSVYSFDITLKNPAIDTLKDQLNIGEIGPVIVVNDETYHGFRSKNFILNLLKGE